MASALNSYVNWGSQGKSDISSVLFNIIFHSNLTLLQRHRKLITLHCSDMAFSGYRENIYRPLCLLFPDLLAIDRLEAEALGNLQITGSCKDSLKKKEYCNTLPLCAFLTINGWTFKTIFWNENTTFSVWSGQLILYAYKQEHLLQSQTETLALTPA